MERLDIKRGNFSKIENDKLYEKMREVFGNCEKKDDWLVSSYGALDPIKIKIDSKKELLLEINTIKIPEDQVLDSVRKRNEVLEFATGFTAKERLKRLKKKAKEGSL
jgi:hypothetical protein